MRLTKKSKQVFKGEIFEVYQWPQKMFDGSFATFERIKRPNTLQVLAVCDDKIILANEEQPDKKTEFSLFGGRQENDETPLEGAKREFLEETGMASEDWELLHSYRPVRKMDWDIYLFIAKNCRKIQEPELESGEKIETIFVSFDEFVDIYTNDYEKGHWLSYYLLKLKQEGKLEELKKKLFENR